jgi:hypothetical protein
MKKICIGLLLFAMILIEGQLLMTWLLPYMDYTGIGIIYLASLLCRCLIYILILTKYDYLWDKYLTNNTVAYRQGLIKLYEVQKNNEYGFMFGVLKKAILELQAGKNPTDVENWVVKMEKEYRSKI